MTRSHRVRRPAPPLRVPPGPVLGVCGWSGSGKTTLLREVIPVLVGRGLSVAALKHDAHGIRVDPAGKDSDRLFRAGADVVLHGREQFLVRTHAGAAVGIGRGGSPSRRQGGRGAGAPQAGELFATLSALLAGHDLVLVEGHRQTPLPKVWVLAEGEAQPPPGLTGVLASVRRDGARAEALLSLLDGWLPRAWREPDVRAGILVGGTSRRMGRPKQLLELDGKTFLERTVEALEPWAENVVLLGDGPVPDACARLPRLPDPPGLLGPLAGILGAMRWAPGSTWILAGCDQPWIREEAIEWLLDQRLPGAWAVMPRIGRAGVEPLPALYDARARRILEAMASGGVLAPTALAGHPRVRSPLPPAGLAEAWRNVNTPADLEALRQRPAGDRAGGRGG